MYLHLQINDQRVCVEMEQTATETFTAGSYTYHPRRIALQVRKLATKMWGIALGPGVLDKRLNFTTLDDLQPWAAQDDFSGSFSPSEGAMVVLGRWNEKATVGIALHELAHEIHLRNGGYEVSEELVREVLSILAEREGGLVREFSYEPYFTASNLVAQLYDIWAFISRPFIQRWAEMVEMTTSVEISDLINYYLDRDENLGLERWAQRHSRNAENRNLLLNKLANCSLQYGLDYRRQIIGKLVGCHPEISLDHFIDVFEAILTLDNRYPEDNLGEIIDFCFAPLPRAPRGILAVVGGF